MAKQRIEYSLNSNRLRYSLPVDKSLRELEVLTGVSASTLSRLFNGQDIDLESLIRLCNYTDKSPGQFFDREVWEVVETKPAEN